MSEKAKEVGPFNGKQKPVRDGVYKRLYPGQTARVWCLFSRGKWYCSSSNYREAKREMWPSHYQDNCRWWGCDHV